MFPNVSVIIPVFNGAKYVVNAIESVRDQTVHDVEVIVIDDGSTDDTAHVLRDLMPSKGVVWFRQPHLGPAHARNCGIKAARGEFVALLDCDDLWETDKLEAQLSILDDHPEIGVVHSDYEIVDEQGIVLEKVRARDGLDPLTRAFTDGHIALPSTLLIRRKLLEEMGGFDHELYGSEDSDLVIRLYKKTGFGCVDRPLVRKLQKGHGYRDKAFDEREHQQRILKSRERFLRKLEQMEPLTARQRRVLNREWANYFLLSGRMMEQYGQLREARHCYRQAIHKVPGRLRGYTRWLRTLLPRQRSRAVG